MKVTSKRLATIAGKVLSAEAICGTSYILEGRHYYMSGSDIRAAFASLLSQTEPKPKKRKVKK